MSEKTPPAAAGPVELVLGPLVERLREWAASYEAAPAALLEDAAATLECMRDEMRGPDGFASWKDAAIDERLKRVQFQRDALRFRFLADRAVLLAIDRVEHETVLTVAGGPHQICGVALADAVDEAMRA